jgi:hypothetical protein
MKLFFKTSGAVLASALLLTANWVAAQESSQATHVQQSPVEQFSVANDGDVLLLPVTFEGKTFLFALDTGSFLTVYDSSLLLGQPRQRTRVETASGDKLIELFDSPNATVGKLSLRAGSFVLRSDLSLFRQVSGHDISGILGMDFLSRYIVQIDFDSGKLSFLHSASEELGERLPIYRQKEGPCINVDVPGLGRSEKFLIDTGSTTFGNMKKGPLETLAEGAKAKKVNWTLTAGLAGVKAQGKWLVECLSVAGVQHRDVVLLETGDNLLGLGFWSRYIVTFDFPNGMMYLKRSKRPFQPNDLDMSGLHILRVNGKTVVHSVDEGSPAAASGIRPNDIIMSIAGDSAEQLSMLALRRLLCSDGKELSITIMRGKDMIEATNVLLRLRPPATLGTTAKHN